MEKSNSKSEKAEIKKIKSLIEENMRLGASEDYAKGYRQAAKDFKRKILLG